MPQTLQRWLPQPPPASSLLVGLSVGAGMVGALHCILPYTSIASPWPVPLAALDALLYAMQWIAACNTAVDHHTRRSMDHHVQCSSGLPCAMQQRITTCDAAVDRYMQCSSSLWSKAWTQRIPSYVLCVL